MVNSKTCTGNRVRVQFGFTTSTPLYTLVEINGIAFKGVNFAVCNYTTINLTLKKIKEGPTEN